jgi:osmotically-inducible protein OsmY
MADRYDREYDRDRSLWRDEEGGERDWENEGGWARGRENQGEFGGSTRRGWGQNMEPGAYDQGRGSQQGQRGGRWYGSQQDEFGRGQGSMSGREQPYGQNYRQGGRMGQGQNWQGQRNNQGWQSYSGGRSGRSMDYGGNYGGMERGGQDWQRQGGYRGQQSGYYGQGRQGYQGQGYNQGWQGQGQGQDWMDDEMEMGFEDMPVTYTYTEYWLVPGPFSGVGPENYTRSAERLREDIIQRLTQHGQINAANIDVQVDDNCEVTLTGEVDNRQAKRLAEDVAESVWGINDVHNQIKVRQHRKGRGGSQSGKQNEGEDQGAQGQRSTTRSQTGTRTKS